MTLQRWLPLPPEERPYNATAAGYPLLDEVIFDNALIHIERMQDGYYWLGISDAAGNTFHFGFEVNGKYLDFAFSPDSSDLWTPPGSNPAGTTAAAGTDGDTNAAGTAANAAPETATEPPAETAAWIFRGPAGADPTAAAAVLAGFGFRCDPAKDQIALGQEHGGYALSGDAAAIKAAFQEACQEAEIPWPQGRPAWESLNYAQRQAVLSFLAESPTWSETGRLRDYAEEILTEYGGLELIFE